MPRHLNLIQSSEHFPLNQYNINHFISSISPIVPFELLPLITSHLVPTQRHASHMFDLPPSLLLHHLITHSPTSPAEMVRSYPLMRVTNSSLPFPMNNLGPPTPNQAPLGAYGLPEPMLVTTESSIPVQNGHVRHTSNWVQRYGEADIAVPPESLPQSKPERHGTSIPPSFSALSPPFIQDRRHSSPPSLLPTSTILPESIANEVAMSPPPLPEVVRAMSSDILANIDIAEDTEKSTVSHSVLGSISPPVAWTIGAAPGLVSSLRPALGNMLLSSCPGKKGQEALTSSSART